MMLAVPRVREPERLGSYSILERLSEGGMGVVYRALHQVTGQEVALKTVRVLDAWLLRGIRREIHALRRLRHPNIVQVVEEGVSDGVPWYAMELLEGVTLRHSLRDLWGTVLAGSEPKAANGALPRWLTVIQRLCSALSFLHGEGLVHRDLKPDNIFMRAGDMPVLVDFGLASLFGGARGRESIDVGGAVEGSFGYMAPEQISGDLVDARADLYALGCILYELVTGRPVFQGGGAQIVKQHLGSAPVPPSRYVADIPPVLEVLILRLLAKQPRDRLGYADDVAATLAELAPALERGCEGERAANRVYLYRPEFSGRGQLLDRLERALDAARLGAGTCVLLGGESGAGKTRMAMEVATAANRRAFRVITGECLSLEAGGNHGTGLRGAPLHPFGLLLEAVADYCRAGGPHVTEALLGSQGGVLARYEPSIASLPGMAPACAEPAQLPPAEVRQRLMDVFVRMLRAFSAEQPLLLVLDDLHWADELSLSMLSALQKAHLERERLVILGTYRTEEEGVLQDLLRAQGVRREVLERLDEDTVAALVGDMLALSAPPKAFTRFLAAQSAGNPFFVAEYLRAAVDEGLLGRSPVGGWQVAERAQALEHLHQALPLPGSLRGLLERWLERLRPRARSLLELAAVLGREIDEALLTPRDASEELEQWEDLEELRTRRVLEQGEAGSLRFAHDKLREITYGGIPPERLRELHRLAAMRIEAHPTGTAPRTYGVLAHHWVMAENREKAFEYLEKAGRHALAISACGEAARFFERALQLDGAEPGKRESPQRRAEWERLLGESHYGLGDIARAKAHMLRAFVELGRPLPRARAGWTGLLLTQVARQALHLVARTNKAKAPEGQRQALRVLALAASRLCEIYYFSQDMLATTVASVLAVNLAEQAGRFTEVRKQYAQLGYMAGLMRMHPLARLYFQRAKAQPESEDPSGIGVALWYEASYEETFGRWGPGALAADESIRRLLESGLQGELQIARTLRGHADYYSGRFSASLPRFEEIRATARARANAQYEAWGTYSAARSLIALGRLDEALERLHEALRILERQEDRASEFICLGLLATAHLYRGELELARERADAVLALAEGKQPTAFMERHGYEGAAMVYLALWEREERAGNVKVVRTALRACGLLERFARFIPLALPAALRSKGLARWLAGQPGRALRTWSRGLDISWKLEMPYDEALLHFELGRTESVDRPSRELHLRRALEGFGAMGCVAHQQEVEKLSREMGTE